MEKIVLGKAVKLHGYLGQFKIATQFDKDFDIKNIKSLFDDAGNEHAVTRIFKVTDGVVVALDGVGLEEAKAMVGREIFISREIFLDKFLIEDIKGSKVCFENGEVLGTVTDVQDYGAAEVVYVLTEKGKELMFPNKSGVIVEFNYKEKLLKVNKEKLAEVADL